MGRLLLSAVWILAWGADGTTEGPWARHTIDNGSRGADGVRLADVNGDGLMDMATGWEEGGVIRVCLHPGLDSVSTTVAWPGVTVGTVRSPEDAVCVDLDGDGNLDVVSSCEGQEKTVWVHWAPKSAEAYLDPGAWQTGSLGASRELTQWMFCLPLDVDNQHGIDLVVGSKNEHAAIGWFESPADPRDLAAWRWRPLCAAGWVMSLVASDIDGDGDSDIVVSNRREPGRGCFWLENPGPARAGDGPWRVQPIGGDDREVMFLTVADLDGDGLEDVVSATAGRELLWFRREPGQTVGWRRSAIPLADNTGTGKAVVVGDIDLDGRPDIVFSCERAQGKSGVMWLSSRDATPDSVWDAHGIGGPVGTKFDLVQLYDVDGDGDLDVVTCEEHENLGVVWYENPERD